MTPLGISVDSAFAHKAFQDQLGIDTTCWPTSSPRALSRPHTALPRRCRPLLNRSLVLIDADGKVEWVHETATLDIPAPNLILDAL